VVLTASDSTLIEMTAVSRDTDRRDVYGILPFISPVALQSFVVILPQLVVEKLVSEVGVLLERSPLYMFSLLLGI
jgi:hypothetical protein